MVKFSPSVSPAARGKVTATSSPAAGHHSNNMVHLTNWQGEMEKQHLETIQFCCADCVTAYEECEEGGEGEDGGEDEDEEGV